MKEIRGHIRANSNNQLMVEEVSCAELARTYGTPLFAISENTMREAYRKFRDAFQSRYEANVVVCVGMKSNYGLAVRKIIAQEGGGGDAFGLGELYVALLAGTDPKKIVMNSPNKDEAVLQAAIQNGIMINVDSLAEIEIVSQIARDLGKTAEVCHRIRVPLYQLEGIMHIDPRYGPPGTDIAKWEREFKFGMEPEALRQAVEQTLAMPEINPRGIMYHGGIPRRAGYSREEVAEIMDHLGDIYRQLRWQPEVIDLGGGFIPSRFGLAEQPSIESYAEAITSTLKAKCQEHGLRLPDLLLEPGRWCVESAGVYITKVGYVKQDAVITNKRWIYVDGSINEMGDPFDALVHYHHILLADRVDAPIEHVADVCGPMCNAADILAPARSVPAMARGDIIVLLDMGAYNESFANQANAAPRSATVLVNGRSVAEVRRRETIQDVLSRDALPWWMLT